MSALQKGEHIDVEVNALTSPHTAVPFSYYKENFGFCHPKEMSQDKNTLGAVLFGDRIYHADDILKVWETTPGLRACLLSPFKP